MEKERLIKAAGYNLITKWEKDFDEEELFTLAKKKL